MLLELVIVLAGTAAFCGWVFYQVFHKPAPPRRRVTPADRRLPDE